MYITSQAWIQIEEARHTTTGNTSLLQSVWWCHWEYNAFDLLESSFLPIQILHARTDLHRAFKQQNSEYKHEWHVCAHGTVSSSKELVIMKQWINSSVTEHLLCIAESSKFNPGISIERWQTRSSSDPTLNSDLEIHLFSHRNLLVKIRKLITKHLSSSSFHNISFFCYC